MDINIAKNKTIHASLQDMKVFITFYAVVLVIPFLVAFGLQPFLKRMFSDNWWIAPLCLATVFATTGSIVFLYLQRIKEQKIMMEQRNYQDVLRRASLGMGQIRDLRRLLKLIVHVVTKTIKIHYCKIYLLHEASHQFVLKAARGVNPFQGSQDVISCDSELVKFLQKRKEPIFLSHLDLQKIPTFKWERKKIKSYLPSTTNPLILPCFIENRLIAIFVLGEKRSESLYTYEDMSLFSILANQSALAIENAEFYSDMSQMHEQLFKAEKMATIGTMSDGLSHQINNRLHAIGFICGDAIDSINVRLKDPADENTKKVLEELKESFDRVEDNVKRGGDIVGGLLKYTRKGDEGFESLDLDKMIDSAIEMVKFKIKIREMEIVRNYDKDTMPRIKGNSTQLQEVFFNIIDNSYDAMMQKKAERKDPHYKPRMDIFAQKKGKNLEIGFKDNGIGVKKEDLEKLFTAFFTTKIENKKGTGLGLFVMRQIIEENHDGKIHFDSQYGDGAETKILLPVAL